MIGRGPHRGDIATPVQWVPSKRPDRPLTSVYAMEQANWLRRLVDMATNRGSSRACVMDG